MATQDSAFQMALLHDTMSTGESENECYSTYMRRKIPITFTVDLDQFERLIRIADRTRTNRSLIVRDALERELTRYEGDDKGKVEEMRQNETA